MQSAKIAISIATPFLASLLVLALAMGAYAQGPGDNKEEEGGIGGLGLADPPPSGFSVLYTFSGAKDTQNAGTNSGATSVHCSNAGTASVQVRVEISDFDNSPTISGTVTIDPSRTGTFSSQNTAFYDEDVAMSTTDDINQGSGRVLVNNSSANIICTAQVLDPVGNPPNYGVKLTLYDSAGNIVGDIRKVFLPIILKQ